jgi:hypothetical protein
VLLPAVGIGVTELAVWGRRGLGRARPRSDHPRATVVRTALAVLATLAALAAVLVAGPVLVRRLERRRRLAAWEQEWVRLAADTAGSEGR